MASALLTILPGLSSAQVVGQFDALSFAVVDHFVTWNMVDRFKGIVL